MNKRLLTSTAVIAVVASLALATQAGATGPRAVTGQFPESGQILDTTSCPFPMTFTYDTIVKYAFVFDAWGNLLHGVTNATGVATESANGITLTGRIADNTHFYNATQRVYEVGLVDNLRLPNGGVVQHDVGRIVWTFDAYSNGGPPTLIAGPHQSLVGDNAALCAALTP